MKNAYAVKLADTMRRSVVEVSSIGAGIAARNLRSYAFSIRALVVLDEPLDDALSGIERDARDYLDQVQLSFAIPNNPHLALARREIDMAFGDLIAALSSADASDRAKSLGMDAG